jgi:hypothetical protein
VTSYTGRVSVLGGRGACAIFILPVLLFVRGVHVARKVISVK